MSFTRIVYIGLILSFISGINVGLGLSLVGDGAKKIEIQNTLAGGSVVATMSGYLIDT